MKGWLRVSLIAFCPVISAQTYTKDIAPIVDTFCAPCHRPGEAAPFSLIDFRDVRSHAKQIAEVTKRRYMPPWKPIPGRGDFEGERRLTEAQIRLFESVSSQSVLPE